MSPEPLPEPAHEGPIVVGAASNVQAPPGTGLLEARFVQYPGCQQLQLWLPRPVQQGYGDLRLFGPGEVLREQAPLSSRLSGSVKLLWDTLAWPPGAYRLEIEHQDGWRHELQLEKFEQPPAAAVDTPDPAQPVLDEDLRLRQQVFAQIERRFARRLEYEGNVRAGSVTYVDGDRRIRFWHEMGGGRVKVFLNLPTEAQWQASTATPVAERAEIVQFVAERVQRDQGMAGFEILPDAINFY